MRDFKIVAVTLLLLCFLQNASAMARYYGNEPGPYIDGGLGIVADEQNFFSENYSDTGGLAAVGQVGYRFHYIALETGVQHYHLDGNDESIVPIDAKLILPLGMQKRLKLFAKFGVGIGTGSGDGTWPLLGVGASYGVTSHLDVGGQWQGLLVPNFFGSGIGRIAAVTANMTYYF